MPKLTCMGSILVLAVFKIVLYYCELAESTLVSIVITDSSGRLSIAHAPDGSTIATCALEA